MFLRRGGGGCYPNTHYGDPLWMTEFIRLKIQQRNSYLQKLPSKTSKSLDYEILKSEIENVASIISERKSDYPTIS